MTDHPTQKLGLGEVTLPINFFTTEVKLIWSIRHVGCVHMHVFRPDSQGPFAFKIKRKHTLDIKPMCDHRFFSWPYIQVQGVMKAIIIWHSYHFYLLLLIALLQCGSLQIFCFLLKTINAWYMNKFLNASNCVLLINYSWAYQKYQKCLKGCQTLTLKRFRFFSEKSFHLFSVLFAEKHREQTKKKEESWEPIPKFWRDLISKSLQQIQY